MGEGGSLAFLKRHLVNAKSANLAFREPPNNKHFPSNDEYRFDTDVPNRLNEQKRLSIYNGNPGPRRGKEGAIEKHIAGKWHIIKHEFLTNRFHVTHHGGCAILFKVSSVYLHDNRDGQQQAVKKWESGWVLQGVTSGASFRRLPRNCKSFFTAMSLHINNQFAKKRGIGEKLLLTIRAVMLEEHADLVAGDFNGAAWR